jgi:hypothetical protein
MSTQNPRPAFTPGAYANIKFSDKWGVTPEVLWSAQGADLKM